jgi:hypothetical protein
VRFEPPRWTLKDVCPLCGQGSCLVLVVCPGCGQLAAVCDAAHATFFNPRKLVADGAASETTSCPGCGVCSADTFEPASADRIHAEGFAPSDYE